MNGRVVGLVALSALGACTFNQGDRTDQKSSRASTGESGEAEETGSKRPKTCVKEVTIGDGFDESRVGATVLDINERGDVVGIAFFAEGSVHAFVWNGGSMKDLIRNEGIDALYACNGLDSEVDGIAAFAQERKIITMGAREEYVNKALAIGVFVIDGKPTILINWGESQKEGASFSSDLVRLAKVINDAGR